MKQPTNQEDRNEDKKKPEKENPSRGIDPESKEPEMEVDQDPGQWQKEKPEPAAGRSAGGVIFCTPSAEKGLSLREHTQANNQPRLHANDREPDQA